MADFLVGFIGGFVFALIIGAFTDPESDPDGL